MPSPRSRVCGVPLVVLLLGLGCAATPPASPQASYDVVHEGFGVRAELDGWQVYRDAESAPAMLRPAFGTKQGPDDPPLFVALRGNLVLTAIVQPAGLSDPDPVFDQLAAGVEQHGEISEAIRLSGSDDILFDYRVGPAGLQAYSRSLLHAADGRVVNLTLAGVGGFPSDREFADAVAGFELHGEGGWRAPWRLPVPFEGEPLAGFEGLGGLDEDPFEAVECAPGEHPLLWTAPAADGGRLHLFGSIHVGHRSFYPFALPIEEAFARADRLVVEVDSRAFTNVENAGTVFEAVALPEEQNLADLVSPELYARIGEAAEELGLALPMLDRMSPGTVGILLSLAPMLERGFNPMEGVDQYFLERAEGKEIVELETQEQQLALIEAFDETFLVSALDSLESFDDDLQLLHRAWRCGDEEALAGFGTDTAVALSPEESARLEEFNEVFLYGRNEAMVRAIEELLEAGGDTFVVVGAAHLVGDRGIPALLRAAGHPVEVVGP